MSRIPLLGVDFDDVSLEDAAARILARPADLPFSYVVTPNADHLARLRRYPALRPLYTAAWLRLLDSRLLFILARHLGLPCPALSPGADLVDRLLPHLAGAQVAVIGMTESDLVALRGRFPLIGWHHHAPPFGLLENPEAFATAVDFIIATAAPITFIALGSPLQEMLAGAVGRRPNAAGLGLCIGAALTFAAGTARRAPVWMRAAGLEWLHRLSRDPGRLAKRYLLHDPPVLLALLKQARGKPTDD